MAKRLISYFSTARARPPAEEFPGLTTREREILALITQHLTNPEIARRLQLSPKTIRNHVSNVFANLQVADRAHAIIRAHEAGLGGGQPR
jgi:DNA-binding NarL/FixJ family response regulator